MSTTSRVKEMRKRDLGYKCGICKLDADKELINGLSNLCRFLAGQQNDQATSIREVLVMDNVEDIKYHLAMETPKIQGTKNQINISKIGNQKVDSSNINKAVNYLLGGNTK